MITAVLVGCVVSFLIGYATGMISCWLKTSE